MTGRLKFAGVIGALILGLVATRAEAEPIIGAFSITGNFLPVDGSGNVVSLDQAYGLDFINDWGAVPTPGIAGEFDVTQATGAFSPIAGGSGLIKDVTFKEGYQNTPISLFQNIGYGFITFDLQTINTLVQNPYVLFLGGTGIFHMAGFDNTPGIFNFTANGFGGTFSFSASEGTAVPVPEPGTLMLLGTGLVLGASQLRRRFQRPT